jgi:hypothetical protein
LTGVDFLVGPSVGSFTLKLSINKVAIIFVNFSIVLESEDSFAGFPTHLEITFISNFTEIQQLFTLSVVLIVLPGALILNTRWIPKGTLAVGLTLIIVSMVNAPIGVNHVSSTF